MSLSSTLARWFPAAVATPAKTLARYNLDDYVSWLHASGMGGSFTYNGTSFPIGLNQTMPGQKTEPIGENFAGYVASGLRGNGIVWVCANVRIQVFSQARFMFQRLRDGRPGDLFANRELRALEAPWAGGTTGDLLGRMILHADFAGNAYVYRGDDGELGLLRPDWTDIILQQKLVNGQPCGFSRFGYAYYDEGHRDRKPVAFLADEVAHFAPLPDPMHSFRGMSWLTPIVREITSDQATTIHKQRFYENAATPNMVVKLDPDVSADIFDEFVDKMEAQHGGIRNAYKTLYLGGGADVTVVGSNFQQLDFKAVQGAGETRIAAASGVGAIIAQLSEGMQGSSLNQGNYGAARRRFSDIPMRHLWQNAAGSLQTLITTPSDARLWYDDADIPFLQEDEKDEAEIRQMEALTMEALIRSGWEANSARDAVMARGDWRQLVKTGLFSVQLQPPLTVTPDAPVPSPNGNGSEPEPAAAN